MEPHFRAFTAMHLWCYEVTELVNCLREGGGSLAVGQLWTSLACQGNLHDGVLKN